VNGNIKADREIRDVFALAFDNPALSLYEIIEQYRGGATKTRRSG
jgi:hypothetical protein